jgi:activator of 2-hydroxyglutaryl-CoA dehydratase
MLHHHFAHYFKFLRHFTAALSYSMDDLGDEYVAANAEITCVVFPRSDVD